jgi:hypothetical protein
MTRKEKAFVELVKAECKKNGVKYKLNPVKYLKLSGNIRCSGYFDDGEKPTLAVAMNKPTAIEILVHEYSHMTQWLDGIDLWKQGGVGVTKIDKWLSGKKISGIDEAFETAIALELDNEKRSVKNIKKFGLEIDVDLYIKKANSYLQFYLWMKETRKWSNPNNLPYENRALLAVMPSNFKMNYGKLSSKLRKVFESEKI